MFERLSDPSRHVLAFAQDEARGLGHNYVGTEHLLLGLLREEEGVAALVLRSLGVTVEAVRTLVEQIVGRGETAAAGEIPLTPRVKRALETSGAHGREIGTEDLLLGIVREREGVAARVLGELGAPPERVDAELSAIVELEPDLADDEAGRVRAEKEAAIEAQDFHRAAVLRARERKLLREEPLAAGPPASRERPVLAALPIAAGAALLGLGIAIGWAIWG